MSIPTDDAYDLAFPRILEAVAQGATRSEAYDFLVRMYPALNAGERTSLLTDALDDALSCGIEREDIDPSWLGRTA